MVDEIYLEKATQYHSGQYVGADDEGNLYKGIVAFMIVGLKEPIPYIVQAILEVKFCGEWLADKMSNCIDDLTIHINTLITQEILARKSTYFMIQSIS